MKILGIDSSGLVAGIAVVQDDILVAEYNVNYKKTHSQTLLPMLDEVRRMLELDLESIDAIAIASGPGSFTGLRIGSATAKGLGLALDKPLVEVPTLEGLAYNLCGTDSLVCPMIDARRNQVYTGIYEFARLPFDGGSDEAMEAAALEGERWLDTAGKSALCRESMRVVKPQCATDVGDMITYLNELADQQPQRSVIFLGDGVPVYRRQLEEKLRMPFVYAPAGNNRQRGASVAALGAVYYRSYLGGRDRADEADGLLGRVVSADAHRPEYLRKSQAEREREESRKEEGAEGEPAE